MGGSLVSMDSCCEYMQCRADALRRLRDLPSHFVQLFNYQDQQISRLEWAKKDLNFRPRAYQARALTN